MKKLGVVSLILCMALLFAGCDPNPKVEEQKQEIIGGQTLEDGRNSGGYVETSIGTKVTTAWFTFTIDSVKQVAEYEGYTPSEGNRLIVGHITMKNTFGEALPMFSSDFQIAWGTGDDEYDIPIDAFCESQIQDEFEMKRSEEVSGDLVFEIPAEEMDALDISFMEIYSDNEYGVTYFVDFKESDISK